MKYVNGRDVFPENLLRQIQKYVSGKPVYIPSDGKKREWGETSGYKRYLAERNREMKAKFRSGMTIEQLAQEYCLSFESVKKIVYSKREVIMLEYRGTLSSAQEYANQNRLEEWVHLYLLSDGHNKGLSDGLKLYDRYFLGPVKMPLSLFGRCCGPEETMRYRIPEEYFEPKVAGLMEIIKREKDMPPLIVHFFGDGKDDIDFGTAVNEFELNDGNHRYEAYRRLGIKEHEVIVWITSKYEYDRFLSKYGQYLQS